LTRVGISQPTSRNAKPPKPPEIGCRTKMKNKQRAEAQRGRKCLRLDVHNMRTFNNHRPTLV
jgi:hypothetical protein